MGLLGVFLQNYLPWHIVSHKVTLNICYWNNSTYLHKRMYQYIRHHNKTYRRRNPLETVFIKKYSFAFMNVCVVWMWMRKSSSNHYSWLEKRKITEAHISSSFVSKLEIFRKYLHFEAITHEVNDKPKRKIQNIVSASRFANYWTISSVPFLHKL